MAGCTYCIATDSCPRFSRKSIIDFVHIINRHVETLALRLHDFEARKKPANLTNAFPALTGDIIMDYFFGFNYDQLKDPEFDSFHEAFVKVGGMGHVGYHFPAIYTVSYPEVTWTSRRASRIGPPSVLSRY